MAVKEYAVKKDGQVLKTYKSLPAAKQLAEKELANIYCDGVCVYRTTPDEEPEAADNTITDESAESVAVAHDKEAETDGTSSSGSSEQYILTAKMNVRSEPSMTAKITDVLDAGTVVDVESITDDWLHLTNGSYILYSGGKFAKKSG